MNILCNKKKAPKWCFFLICNISRICNCTISIVWRVWHCDCINSFSWISIFWQFQCVNSWNTSMILIRIISIVSSSLCDVLCSEIYHRLHINCNQYRKCNRLFYCNFCSRISINQAFRLILRFRITSSVARDRCSSRSWKFCCSIHQQFKFWRLHKCWIILQWSDISTNISIFSSEFWRDRISLHNNYCWLWNAVYWFRLVEKFHNIRFLSHLCFIYQFW